MSSNSVIVVIPNSFITTSLLNLLSEETRFALAPDLPITTEY